MKWINSLDCNFDILVYDRRIQKLKIVAPMPKQIGTTTMHFPGGVLPSPQINALWRSLGMTSKFRGNSLSLQCKDRVVYRIFTRPSAGDPLPPLSLHCKDREFPGNFYVVP